jgi:hypothetical protein
MLPESQSTSANTDAELTRFVAGPVGDAIRQQNESEASASSLVKLGHGEKGVFNST